jgi:hypothetical protein
MRLDIGLASATLQHSMDVIASALTGPREGVYTRSSAIFDRAERRLEEHPGAVGPGQLAIRDLMLIDTTMATLAEALGLAITDYDTAPAGSGSSGGAGAGRRERSIPARRARSRSLHAAHLRRAALAGCLHGHRAGTG